MKGRQPFTAGWIIIALVTIYALLTGDRSVVLKLLIAMTIIYAIALVNESMSKGIYLAF